MTASLEWDHRGDTPVLQVVGRWTLDQPKPELSEVWRQGGRLPESLVVEVKVSAWDSSLLALLRRLQRLDGSRNLCHGDDAGGRRVLADDLQNLLAIGLQQDQLGRGA